MFYKNKIIKLILLCLILSTTIPALAMTNNQKPLTLILDWFVNPDHAPLFVAEQQGYFKQQGIQIKFITPADPSDPSKLVAAGKADLAVTYQPQLTMQVSEGWPLVRIATLVATPLNCLMVKANGPIHTPADLKGKKIAYGGGAVDHAMLDAMLAQHHLSPNDVQMINVKYDLAQALLTNKVDAVTGVVRNFEPIEAQLAGQPVKCFYAEENGMPPYDELVIVTNKRELTDPRLAKFVTALELGVQYLVNHPEESWEKFAKAHPELNNELNKRSWFATLPRFALRPAAVDQARYTKLARFLQQEGLIKTLPETNQYVIELTH